MEDYASEIRKTISSAFFLLFGDITSNLINAVAGILVIRYLSPSDYGLLSVALIVPGLFSLFRDWGIPTATAKFVAELDEKRKSDLRTIMVTASIMVLVSSSFVFLVGFLLADFFSIWLFNKPVADLIRVALVLMVLEAVREIGYKVLIGRQRTEFIGISKILGGITRIAFVVYLVIYLRFEALGALAAQVTAMIVMTLIGFIAVKKWILSENSYNNRKSPSFNTGVAKNLYSFGIPLTLSGILSRGSTQYSLFLFAILATSAEIGYYGAANHFISLATLYLIIPFSTSLFATFAKMHTKPRQSMLKVSVKFNAFLLMLCFSLLLALSEPLVNVVYTERYEPAVLLLRLLSFTILIQAFGTPIFESYLKGVGETKTIFRAGALYFVIGMVTATVLIPLFGLFGIILYSIILPFVTLVYYLRHFIISKVHEFNYPIKDLIMILFSAIVASGVSYIAMMNLLIPDIFKLIFGLCSAALIYMTLLPLVGGIRKLDISYMYSAFESWRGIKTIARPILNFMSRLARK